MIILVLNSGSSSLKFQLLALEPSEEKLLASGSIERIGGEALLTLKADDKKEKRTAPLRDMRQALDAALKWIVGLSLPNFKGLGDIQAVGHRVVHGGERFKASVLIDADVLAGIEDCIELAPLHNPANLRGIQAVREIMGPNVPQIAAFDTAFHAAMPESAAMYALPYSLYRRHKIRRYGFHGTSYRYITQRFSQLSGIAADRCHLIIFHLGNGCSVCAVKNGVSVDTSMGMTPVEGLVMGTRSGDIDPAIAEVLAFKEGMESQEFLALLNRSSGLLGISGLTHDMRELIAEAEENQDRRAKLAIDVFCYRARKYLGAYSFALGKVDAVIFCGGIGENAAVIRQKICEGLEGQGIAIDAARNKQERLEGRFSKDESQVQLWVIPTNEEIMIARDARDLVVAPIKNQ